MQSGNGFRLIRKYSSRVKDALDESRLIETIQRLMLRIADRFPDSGLYGVARELYGVACNNREDLAYIQRSNLWLRGGVYTFIALVLGLLGYAVASVPLDSQLTLSMLIQLSEAGINDLVLIGAAAVFLVSLETRTKRRRIVEAVNRLRSIAHVVDMHQLTKDPTALMSAERTKHSPRHDLPPVALSRYLDYCSELLSLTAKVAYLYVQHFPDPQAVDAVNDLETLTNGLSRKIWQKIVLVRQLQVD